MTPPNLLASEFLHYNLWANLKLIDACTALTPEQLEWDAPGVFGSIYDTLKHLVSSEVSYYRRISGVQIEIAVREEDRPTLEAIRATAAQTGAALAQAAEQMQYGDTLPRTWNDEGWEDYPPRFRAAAMLIQVVNHGVEHRTNVTTTLAHHGISAPELDGWDYLGSNPERLGALL